MQLAILAASAHAVGPRFAIAAGALNPSQLVLSSITCYLDSNALNEACKWRRVIVR